LLLCMIRVTISYQFIQATIIWPLCLLASDLVKYHTPIGNFLAWEPFSQLMTPPHNSMENNTSMLLTHVLLQLINTSVTPPIQSTFVATWLGAVIASSIAMVCSHMTDTVRVAAKGAVTTWPPLQEHLILGQ